MEFNKKKFMKLAKHMKHLNQTAWKIRRLKQLLIKQGALISENDESGQQIYEEQLAFIKNELKANDKQVVEEILLFLDKLEMEQPEDLKTDNWRNWKYIRNSIVDKYNIPTQVKSDSLLERKK